MGCPNLPLDPKNPEGEKGAIFVAVKGQGAFQVSFCVVQAIVSLSCRLQFIAELTSASSFPFFLLRPDTLQ